MARLSIVLAGLAHLAFALVVATAHDHFEDRPPLIKADAEPLKLTTSDEPLSVQAADPGSRAVEEAQTAIKPGLGSAGFPGDADRRGEDVSPDRREIARAIVGPPVRVGRPPRSTSAVARAIVVRPVVDADPLPAASAAPSTSKPVEVEPPAAREAEVAAIAPAPRESPPAPPLPSFKPGSIGDRPPAASAPGASEPAYLVDRINRFFAGFGSSGGETTARRWLLEASSNGADARRGRQRRSEDEADAGERDSGRGTGGGRDEDPPDGGERDSGGEPGDNGDNPGDDRGRGGGPDRGGIDGGEGDDGERGGEAGFGGSDRDDDDDDDDRDNDGDDDRDDDRDQDDRAGEDGRSDSRGVAGAGRDDDRGGRGNGKGRGGGVGGGRDRDDDRGGRGNGNGRGGGVGGGRGGDDDRGGRGNGNGRGGGRGRD